MRTWVSANNASPIKKDHWSYSSLSTAMDFHSFLHIFSIHLTGLTVYLPKTFWPLLKRSFCLLTSLIGLLRNQYLYIFFYFPFGQKLVLGNGFGKGETSQNLALIQVTIWTLEIWALFHKSVGFCFVFFVSFLLTCITKPPSCPCKPNNNNNTITCDIEKYTLSESKGFMFDEL